MDVRNLILPKIGESNQLFRHEWIIRQLKSLPAGLRILDAGAGQQFYKKYCKHLNYVSQDFAAYIPSETAQGLQNPKWDYGKLDIISDITQIPKPDASFDVILCSEVLEHLPYPSDAIKEFARLLKPNGIVLFTAPFSSLTHQSPYYFSTGFSIFYYQRILDDMGFENIETTANGSFFEYMGQESKRLNYVAREYCGKKGLNFYQKIITTLFIRILNKLNKNEKGSDELLCFGYFVKAIKK